MFQIPMQRVHFHLSEPVCGNLLLTPKLSSCLTNPGFVMGTQYPHCCLIHTDLCYRQLHRLPMSRVYPPSPKQQSENLHNQFMLYTFLASQWQLLVHCSESRRSSLLFSYEEYHPKRRPSRLKQDTECDSLHRQLTWFSMSQKMRFGGTLKDTFHWQLEDQAFHEVATRKRRVLLP